jgi:hypothetical protein
MSEDLATINFPIAMLRQMAKGHFGFINQAQAIRWFKDDNSLIVSNTAGYVKYSLNSRSVVATLNVASASGGTWSAGSNFAGLHHTDDRVKSIWVVDTIIDGSHPSPIGQFIFPRFTEIRMTDLTVGRILVSYEWAQSYVTHLTESSQ